MKYILVISIIYTIFVSMIIKCKTDSWDYKLIHDILNGYDPSIRPSEHHNHTLNVTFGLALAQLIDVVITFIAILMYACMYGIYVYYSILSYPIHESSLIFLFSYSHNMKYFNCSIQINQNKSIYLSL